MFSSKMEMARGFDALMNRTYKLRKDYQRHKYEENLVKTHIVELHTGTDLLRSRTRLEESLRALATYTKSQLFHTNDWLFYGLSKSNLSMYLEVVDERFVLLHSASRADTLERFVNDATRDVPFLDQAWFPSKFLESTHKTGQFRGFRLRHDNWLGVKHRSQFRDSSLRKFSMNLSLTEGAEKALAELKSMSSLRGAINVSGVEIRVQDNNNLDRFALSDVYASGKVTARGTSFQLHHDFTVQLCAEYSQKVRRLEDKYRISWVKLPHGVSVEGSPFEIEFTPALEDVQLFCENLLSGAYPFRLWGIPHFLADDYASVQAVDLHVGHQLMMDIAPQFMRVYLPEGTCGNTILRLVTNLQGHLNNSITVFHQGGEVTFEVD